MMKRGISLITALMLSGTVTASAFAMPMMAPVYQIKAAGNADFAMADQVVSYGVKKVTVPVILSAEGIAALDASISVKADAEGAANPVITNITDGIYEGVMANSKYEDGSERKFVWVDASGLGYNFAKQPVAYVDIELPADAKVGSTYTVKLYDLDPADSNKEDIATSAVSYEAKIVVGDNVIKGYETFMEDAEGYAGTVVNVPVEVICPEMIDAIVADFTIDGGAKIVGYTTDDSAFDAANFMDSVSNENKVLWATPDNSGINVAKRSNFVTLKVQIPADAKVGTEYNISLNKDLDTSTVDGVDITPSKYANAVITVIEKGVKGDLTAEIGSKDVYYTQKTVELPVMVSHEVGFGGFAAFVAKFDVTNADGKKAEIVSVKAGSAINAEDFLASVSVSKGVWNSADSEDVAFAVKADNTRNEIFVLEIALPDDREVGDVYDVSFVEGSVDIGTSALQDLIAKQINGKITIAAEDDKIDAYTISIGSKELDATGEKMTVKLPVYLDGAEINTFAGTFEVSNGAVIKSITSSYDGLSTGKENPNRVVWQGADGQDTKFDAKTPFAMIEVEIPAELAVKGKSFVVSVSDVDSANANHANVAPVKPYGQGVISLTGETDTFDMLIDNVTADVKKAEAITVDVPVYINAENFYALDGTFSIDPTVLGANGGVIAVDFEGDGASANGTEAGAMALNSVVAGSVKVTSALEGLESFTAEIVEVADLTGNATVSLGKDNKGNVVWTLDDKTGAGLDFNIEEKDEFVVVKVKVTPVIKPADTTPSDTEPTATATEPTATATEPTATVTEPTATETEPTATVTEPTATVTEPTATVTEPTATETEPTATVTEPTATETEPTATVTEPTATVTEPTATVTEPTATVTEPTATVTEPTATVTEPTATVTEPTATVTEPTATVTEPTATVTEPTATTSSSDINIVITEKPKVPGVDGDYKAIASMPNTKFYFSHEEGFNLDGLKVEVEVEEVWSNGDKTTKTVDITKDVVVKGNATPATTYDKSTFKYEIEVVYVGSEYKELVDVNLGSFTAYIGQKGDISLDHEVDTRDVTWVIKEYNEIAFGGTAMDKLLEGAKLPEGLLEAAGTDTIVDFAKFLGNADENNENDGSRLIDTRDASLIKYFYTEFSFADVMGEVLDVADTWNKLMNPETEK